MSYKSTISKYKKSLTKEVMNEEEIPFNEYLINIDEIDNFNFPFSKYIKQIKLLFNDNGILSSIMNKSITSDMLTGYYFAKFFTKGHKLFIGGCVNNVELLKGFEMHFSNVEWYGTDKKLKYMQEQIPKNIFLGITEQGDLANINCVKSIAHQLPTQTNITILDINNDKILLTGLVFVYYTVLYNGVGIIRLPPCKSNTWEYLNFSMASYFTIAKELFKNIKIFICPWNNKLYLILKHPYKRKQNTCTKILKNSLPINDNEKKTLKEKKAFPYMDFDKMIEVIISKILPEHD